MEVVNDFVVRVIQFGRSLKKKKNNKPYDFKHQKARELHSDTEISSYIPTHVSEPTTILNSSSKLYRPEITKMVTRVHAETTIKIPFYDHNTRSDNEQIIEQKIYENDVSKKPVLLKENSVISNYSDTGFNSSEEQLITEKFNKLTQDGKLTKTQFTDLYNDLRTEDPERLEKITEVIYNAFDTNKDGVISLEEFLSGYTITNYANIKKKLNFLFELYDRNGEGHLKTSDIGYVIEAMISLLNAELDLNAEKIAEECFRDLDANHDGKVSKEEFVIGLQKNYALRSLMNPFN